MLGVGRRNATTRPERADPAGGAERFTRGRRANRRQVRRRQRGRNLIVSDVSAAESSRAGQIGRAPHDNKHHEHHPLRDVKMFLGLIARRIAATQLLYRTANLNGEPEAAATTVLVSEQRDPNSVCLVVSSLVRHRRSCDASLSRSERDHLRGHRPRRCPGCGGQLVDEQSRPPRHHRRLHDDRRRLLRGDQQRQDDCCRRGPRHEIALRFACRDAAKAPDSCHMVRMEWFYTSRERGISFMRYLRYR